MGLGQASHPFGGGRELHPVAGLARPYRDPDGQMRPASARRDEEDNVGRTSATMRTARSRSSSGYLLERPMTQILPRSGVSGLAGTGQTGRIQQHSLPSLARPVGRHDDPARRASAEGDLREGLDPDVVSESILNAMLGAQLLSKTADGNDHIEFLARDRYATPQPTAPPN